MLERATTKCREMLQGGGRFISSRACSIFSRLEIWSSPWLRMVPWRTLRHFRQALWNKVHTRTPHIYSRGTIVTPSVFAALLLMCCWTEGAGLDASLRMDTHQPGCFQPWNPPGKTIKLTSNCLRVRDKSKTDNGRTLSKCEIDNPSNMEKMKAANLLIF